MIAEQDSGGLVGRITAVLSHVATTDDCIHCSGFAMDALNRLASTTTTTSSGGDDAASSSALAAFAPCRAERDRLLASPSLMPCVNWETVARGSTIADDTHSDGSWRRLIPMALEVDARRCEQHAVAAS